MIYNFHEVVMDRHNERLHAAETERRIRRRDAWNHHPDRLARHTDAEPVLEMTTDMNDFNFSNELAQMRLQAIERKLTPHHPITIFEFHPGRSIKRVLGIIARRSLIRIRRFLAGISLGQGTLRGRRVNSPAACETPFHMGLRAESEDQNNRVGEGGAIG